MIPTFGCAAVAAAVARPATKAVRTTPRSALAARPRFDADFKRGLVRLKKLAVVRHAKAVALGIGFERISDAAVAPTEVVAETLAVGRDADDPCAGPCGTHARADERVARREQALEGDAARDLAVVEEDRERAPRAIAVEVFVRNCRVNADA